MLFSVELAFVGRDEIRAPLKTLAWEAGNVAVGVQQFSQKRLKLNYLPVIEDPLYPQILLWT